MCFILSKGGLGMATYRNIQLSFWTDAKIADEFTPEDRYFYLYLLTNPHTNTCGCYELSIRQMSIETGYSQETIQRLIDRFAIVHDIIRYSRDNKELLIMHWYRYNWTTSDKLRISIANCIKAIKTLSFKKYLIKCFEGYEEGSDIDDISDDSKKMLDESLSDTTTEKPQKRVSKPKPEKHLYGEYKHVRLTDDEYDRLVRDYGEEATHKGIKKVDEYCQQHGKTYTDYNLTIRKWGIESPKIVPQKTTDGQVRRTLQ